MIKRRNLCLLLYPRFLGFRVTGAEAPGLVVQSTEVGKPKDRNTRPAKMWLVSLLPGRGCLVNCATAHRSSE